MRRRTFFTALGGAGLAEARFVRAQSSATVWRIGALTFDAPEPFLQRLTEGLRSVGYVNGQNLHVEMRAAEGRTSLLSDLAADLVRRQVDLIVARLTPAVRAARQATSTMPIVMAGAGDPVGTGLVASLARPGGNVTGIAGVADDLAGKLVEIIRDMLPSARRVAVLANPTDSFTLPFLDQIGRVASAIGMEIRSSMIADESALEAAFHRMSVERPDAVIVQPSLPRRTAARLARAQRLPCASPIEGFAAEGGVVAYGSDVSEVYQQAALYVDKILKGARPADLPVTQSTRFTLTINLAAARAIGLDVPPSVLARADEVIE
jgi:putative tryptophan/tyrosine transport system substrate-binding protein